MKLRYGVLLPALMLLAACSEEIAESCQAGVTNGINEVVVRPVLFMECTYTGNDVVDEDSGDITLMSGTTIRTDLYLSRPLLSDGEWVGFVLFDEVTGLTQNMMFEDNGARGDWTCADPVPGETVES